MAGLEIEFLFLGLTKLVRFMNTRAESDRTLLAFRYVLFSSDKQDAHFYIIQKAYEEMRL